MGIPSLPESLLQITINLLGQDAGLTEIPPDAVLALLADTAAFHLAMHMPDPSSAIHRATVYSEITGRIDTKLDEFVVGIKHLETLEVRH